MFSVGNMFWLFKKSILFYKKIIWKKKTAILRNIITIVN